MDERVLFVDDEKNVLEGIQRQLRKEFQVSVAQGPEEGLEAVRDKGPFAVIVSDLRMPGMDGVRFLSRVLEMAPDSVRMVLTGYADLPSAIQAVNEGHVFRFLTKPCDQETLSRVLRLGIQQYRLVTAEKELLQKTLQGSIRMLIDVLSLVNPEAFGRASRIKRYARDVALHLGLPDVWRVETAAMLSQIGCVVLSEEVMRKISKGLTLSEEERQAFDMHPGIGAELISKIPRMQKVAEIVALQENGFDGEGIPAQDPRSGEDIPIGASILKVVLDFDLLEGRGVSRAKALAALRKRSRPYDPGVLSAMEAVLGMEAKYQRLDLMIRELRAGMVLDQEVKSKEGRLLIGRGQELSRILLSRLNAFSSSQPVKEPIRVLVPVASSTQEAVRPEG
ncbi:MAG: HD domain-containing phosphohydrolase [Desulfobacteraceae bacterium]